MITINHLKTIDWLLPLIFLLALLPRLLQLDLIEYKADEALTIFALRQFFQEPQLFQAGLISSTGARNFPLFHYLLLLPGSISLDPRFLSGFIGLLNAGLIAWFYLAVKRFYHRPLALISSLIFATGPWLVIFSRKIWAQDLIPLLAIPLFILLHQVKKKPSKLHFFLLGAVILLLIQLHASGLFLSLLIIPLVWPHLKKRLPVFLLGCLLGLLPALPYFHLQLTSQPFCPDCRAYLNQSGQIRQFDPGHLYRPGFILTGLYWSELLGPDMQRLQSDFPVTAIAQGFALLILLGLAWSLFQAGRQPANRWLLVPVVGLSLVYLLFQVPAHLHYYQVLVPWLALLAGLGLYSLPPSQRIFVWPVITLVAAFNLIFIFAFYAYLSRQSVILGDYGTPYIHSSRWVSRSLKPFSGRPDFSELTLIAEFHLPSQMILGPASVDLRLANHFFTTGQPELARPLIDDLKATNASGSAVYQYATDLENHHQSLLYTE
jgi:hypothetical protein